GPSFYPAALWHKLPRWPPLQRQLTSYININNYHKSLTKLHGNNRKFVRLNTTNMKQVTAILLSIMLFAGTAFAGDKTKDGINWMTWDEAQVAMKKQPKKVWVDVYTDWCGWCKVMDKKTFSNPEVIR